jgi:NADH-quinone oxidoreductase subunit N
VTNIDLHILLPFILLAATAITVMLSIAFYRSHILSAFLTLAGIAASFVSLINTYPLLPGQITVLFILDRYAFFYTALTLAASFIVVLLSYGYLEKQDGNHEEFYILLLLATLGSVVLIASSHFVALFLGLEMLSVSLYVLIAYLSSSERGIEAGIKYLVLAAVSSAFLLFGIALVYAELGTMSFSQVAAKASGDQNLFFSAGTAMIIVGIGFKLAVAPFHMWTPDVYEGAPAPVSGFIATVSKGAVFAFLLRYFSLFDFHMNGALFFIFTVIAIASMFTGNILALMQDNVKRILAYSSIAHLGYLLTAFLAGRTFAFTAVSFYLAAYFITTLGAFGIITVLSGSKRDADMIDDYRGLAWRRPWLALIFSAMLLSLAGIPLTAGFIGKFYIIRAGAGSALWLLLIMLVINSAIGLFYYLRVIAALFRSPEAGARSDISPETSAPIRTAFADNIVLSALAVVLFWLGIFPSFLIDMILKIENSLIH